MRFLLAPAVIAVLVAGIWITGGKLTNDFALSMVLTAAWMGLAGLACFVIAVRRRELRIPVLGAYLLTAVVVGGYLASETFVDDVVDERVAVAAPMATKTERPQNVQLARGTFQDVAHPGSGSATAIRLAKGGRVLTLTDFEVDNGPDLRVYLVAGSARDEGDVTDYIDLGGLKGNKGNQQYDIPRNANLDRYRTVVIWCRAFSVLFIRAPLT